MNKGDADLRNRRAITSFFAASFLASFCFLASCDRPLDPDEQRLANWRQAETSLRHLHVGGKWHFDFHSVRLYRINWEDQFSYDSMVSNGELNKTRLPEDGILLTSAQVERLEAAVTGSHPEAGGAMCRYPHHGFVFFDKEGAIVGNIEVCFICDSYRGWPDKYVYDWDLLSIAEIIHEAGLPLSNPDWE